MGNTPSFSVFVPNYNHGNFIDEALQALLAQSVQPRAIYVVDDCSTDNSRTIIERYVAQYPHVHATYLKENGGVIKNMNDWIGSVDDEYVYFAAADDVVMPGFFEKSLLLLASNPGAGLVSSLTVMMNEDGGALGMAQPPRPCSGSGFLSPADVARSLYTEDSWINGNTVVYHRETLLSAGGFHPELEGFADGFAFRVVALLKGACFIEEPLAKRRQLDSGYANMTTNSADIALRVADRAALLMEGDYSNVFPAGYAQRWRQRWLFGSVIGQLNMPRSEAYLSISQLLEPLGTIKKLLVKVVLLTPIKRLKKLVAQLCFSIIMRPYDLRQAIYRRLFANVVRKLKA